MKISVNGHRKTKVEENVGAYLRVMSSGVFDLKEPGHDDSKRLSLKMLKNPERIVLIDQGGS